MSLSQSQPPPQSPPPPTENKKWYEDDDLTVTENTNTKESQRQSEFGPGVIGTEFNAIKVKLQETYEIGILKLFIETEILKRGSNEFEPGLKELYEPLTMTKPFNVGKELLFTSDVEFSEAGFLPGSLQDDRRKYFLNFLEFNNYLLRLPKPISDIETPVKEKTDSNAYKYLQVLGSEESKMILMICDDFKKHNDEQEKKNANAIIKLQKDLDDAKKLVVGAKITQAEKTKIQEDIERQLKNEKDKKIKLETKYKNYKAACKILSNAVRRMQYDVTIVDSYPETVKDGKSLSTTIVDWLKYKQNNPNFIREVLTIFKPMLSNKAKKEKETISANIQEIIRSLSSIFKPIIESYFYNTLMNNFGILAGANPDDINFLNGVIVPANRTNDPIKYSWNNISSTLERVSKLRFGNVVNKNIAENLYIISNFMVNFQSDLLRFFTFNTKDGGIEKMIQEIEVSDSFLNTGRIVNMLYHNIVYLKAMLDKITEVTRAAAIPAVLLGLAALLPPLLPEQQVQPFLQRLTALRQLVEASETSVREFRLMVAMNSYKTILGEAPHAVFVESIFSEKVPPISNANRNNKFLIVSDFITDAYDNSPVTITISDNYYDLETLGTAIEKELCDKCKWRVDANVPTQNRDMIWSCKYDENKKMQLKLYFPQNDLMNRNNIIPNIHDIYPVNFISRGVPAVQEEANNTFQLSGGFFRGGLVKTLTIPQGEYRDIQHLLYVMQKTINDFIGNESSDLTQVYKTEMKITLTALNRVKFEFKSDNAEKLRLAMVQQTTAQNNYTAMPTVLNKGKLLVQNTNLARVRKFYSNTENEILTLTLTAVNPLSRILGSTIIIAYGFNSAGPNLPLFPNPYEHTMGIAPDLTPPSKSVKIQTRMRIDGDEYDASAMFGIPSSIAPQGVITITPEIIIRELALRKDENNNVYKNRVNEMLDYYFGFSQLAPPVVLERISDYGVLNFTIDDGFRITVGATAITTPLDAVDLSKIGNKGSVNGDNFAKFKTELMDKTGLYINNSLLQAKVPVITSTDILNSLFYRYPCIPSTAAGMLEGSPEFYKFIEERVNVSKFKEVVWLGKGINDTSEPLSLTIRKALDKTLMYDDCDEERSKLMCDLHYAICGPVFTNTALNKQNQYGETDELEMFHRFKLEIKRPDILDTRGIPLGQPQHRPIVKPFTVKGITPYYDAASKRYKYLIYGHYLNFTNAVVADRQVGCVKYYDPGTKIGTPEQKSMELYDILLFLLAAGGPATVNSVVEFDFNKDDESFIYPVFIIAGVFDRTIQFDGLGNPMDFAAQTNNVVWTPGKMDAGLPFTNANRYVYTGMRAVRAEIARTIPGATESNSFDIIWNVSKIVGRGPRIFPNLTNRVGLLTIASPFVYDIPGVLAGTQVAVMFILNTYTETCPKCIICKRIDNDSGDGESFIFLPYMDAVPAQQPNPILLLGRAPYLPKKITCGAVSINKDVFNINKQIHLYQREYMGEVSSLPPGIPASNRLIDIQNKIDELDLRLRRRAPPGGLISDNPLISHSMLWIGLKEQCDDTAAGVIYLKILSCSIINIQRHLMNPATPPDLQQLVLPVTFKPDDFIEKIKVDINDPEIVTVFGRFTATIQDRDPTKVKTIQNAMVIYTNLGNRYNNNENYGDIAAVPNPYSLEYDNFQPLTVNSLPEFKGYYSCVDGLIVASNHGSGNVQQNMGTLLVKKTQTSTTPVLIGFHDNKITELTIDEQYSVGSDMWSSILCYDYNMCADIIQYDETNPMNRTTVIDKGLFNPLSFNAFKTTLENVDVDINPGVRPLLPPYVYTTNQQRVTELFNGEFVLVETKQSRAMTNALSKLHVLNTWGVDLSNESTPYSKRMVEKNVGTVNMKIYEMYINKVVDTIIGSAKKYYEDKIKNSLYDEDYGVITTSSPPGVRFRRQGTDNVVVTGGGRREDAAAMIVAKQIELEEMKKLQRYDNKNKSMQKIESIVEIRIPDIMMSDAYLAAFSTNAEKEKARKSFFDALCKYSKKVKETAIQENIKNSKMNREQGNVVIEDIYKVVLCSSKLKEFKFDNMYDDKIAGEKSIKSVLTLSPDLYDYDLDVKSGVKNVIIVNEWNDRGFIGDYGAFAFADSSSLTPNQTIISKTMKVNPGVANQVVEFVPKIANSSFLLNPFITYGSFDSSRWTGINSLDDKDAVVVQVGGGRRENELRMMQIQEQIRQEEFKNARLGLQFGSPYINDLYRQLSELDDEGIMQRQVLEKTNASSSMLSEDRTRRMMRPDSQVKRVVLWLCNFREGKMLMVKTSVGTNIILSLPTQKQYTGANESGYDLLQELCRKHFQTEAVLTRWTLEHTYISSTGTGIFIYNAKASELPKVKTDTVYVSMNAVYKFSTATAIEESKHHASIFNSDKPIIVEVFKVVKLISGGIISSTSKEFNDVLAALRSKTVPPHLRSIISVTKRKNNVEANVNFLIKLFFSPNNLIYIRGANLPYYIYSSQRNDKIYSIIKQQGYEDDSYLTCLKLFLQTEADFKSKDKDKSSNFRVGCAVKKKLITDNFSAVWDKFWGDLIESEEESKLDDQLAEDIGEGEGIEGKKDEGKKDEGKKDEVKKDKGKKDEGADTSTICLDSAIQSGVKMYDIAEDWKVSNYRTIKYNDVYYNIRPNEKYRFNNEYFYNLNSGQLLTYRFDQDDSYLGFNCIAYYKNGNNPVLFLGYMGASANPQLAGRIYKLDLKTHKLKLFVQMNNPSNVRCMDILDVEEGGYMLIGGNFTQVTTYKYEQNRPVPLQSVPIPTILPVVLINLNTYEIIQLYDAAGPVPQVIARASRVTNVCICKTKKIVKAKGGGQDEVEGYIAMIGGKFKFDIMNDFGVREQMAGIGCVLIRKNPNSTNLEARLVAVDTKVSINIRNGLVGENNITSIVCQENEDKNQNNKSETVFFIGGKFSQYNAFDYVAYEEEKVAAAAAGRAILLPNPIVSICNGIIKLTLKCEYDADNAVRYNQASVIETINVGNADKIFFASLQYGIINLKKYLFCFTAFWGGLTNDNVYTRLNVFDVEFMLNVLQTPNVQLTVLPPILRPYYSNQTLLLTKDDSERDNVKNILIMSISISVNANFVNHTFTCNISELNKDAAPPISIIIVASNENPNVEKNNIIWDMFYWEDSREVFIAHGNVLKDSFTEYPLTIRSNYQALGEWKLESTLADNGDEIEKINKFIDKVFEMRKIFKLNPSMILFLQDVDNRQINEDNSTSSKITEARLEKIKNDLIIFAGNNYTANNGLRWLVAPNVSTINIKLPCNQIDTHMIFVVRFVRKVFLDIAVPAPVGETIIRTTYQFTNGLILLLIYSGCNKLAEIICNNYVKFVTLPQAQGQYVALDNNNWKDRFKRIINVTKIEKLIDTIAKNINTLSPNISDGYFKICSDPETRTGVAYLEYNYNKNTSSLITLNNQDNIKNKIYEDGKAAFFSSSGKSFYSTVVDPGSVVPVERIIFCSFYKFNRMTLDRIPTQFGNIGNADSETIYTSVDIKGDDINSGQVFEFLNIIRDYFKNLSSGEIIVDIGISGPIKRIIFGGNFGCNLLNDAEVCRKFKSKQMKIYTSDKNNNILENRDVNKKNQIFMIDVDLEPPVVQGGGGNGGDYKNDNNNQKRICIGARIEENHRVVSNKRKTRRKVPLMLSSS